MNKVYSLPIDPELDYLVKYKDLVDYDNIISERAKRNEYFGWKGSLPYYPILEQIEHLSSPDLDASGSMVTIGKDGDLSGEDTIKLQNSLKDLMPWRKGPFNLFGIELDAEWRSDFKWNRISEYMKKSGMSLEGKRIADIGCNNGYYMFRMLNENPELVVGFDPQLRYFFQFHAINQLLENSPLHYEIMGVEEIRFYEKFFDVIFCLGVIYHNSDPIGILRKMHASLEKDGVLIIESQGIPGEECVALFPNKVYAKVPGTYFVPTVSCLKNWLQKAQFKDIEVFYTHKLGSEEQRRTEWMDWQSLDDFLDPNDKTKTIEGYPAPIRIYVKAVKK